MKLLIQKEFSGNAFTHVIAIRGFLKDGTYFYFFHIGDAILQQSVSLASPFHLCGDDKVSMAIIKFVWQ